MQSLLDYLTRGKKMPRGFDSWGMKTVNPLRETANSFQWAKVGGFSVSNDHIDTANTSGCPSWKGDGLAVAVDEHAMCSGGLPLNGILLVAFRSQDVLGSETGKARVGGRVRVVYETTADRIDYTGLTVRACRFRHLAFPAWNMGGTFINCRFSECSFYDSFSFSTAPIFTTCRFECCDFRHVGRLDRATFYSVRDRDSMWPPKFSPDVLMGPEYAHLLSTSHPLRFDFPNAGWGVKP